MDNRAYFMTADRAAELLQIEGYSRIMFKAEMEEFLFFNVVDPFGMEMELRVEKEPEEMGPDHFSEEFYHNVCDRSFQSNNEWEWITVIASYKPPREIGENYETS